MPQVMAPHRLPVVAPLCDDAGGGERLLPAVVAHALGAGVHVAAEGVPDLALPTTRAGEGQPVAVRRAPEVAGEQLEPPLERHERGREEMHLADPLALRRTMERPVPDDHEPSLELHVGEAQGEDLARAHAGVDPDGDEQQVLLRDRCREEAPLLVELEPRPRLVHPHPAREAHRGHRVALAEAFPTRSAVQAREQRANAWRGPGQPARKGGQPPL